MRKIPENEAKNNHENIRFRGDIKWEWMKPLMWKELKNLRLTKAPVLHQQRISCILEN